MWEQMEALAGVCDDNGDIELNTDGPRDLLCVLYDLTTPIMECGNQLKPWR
ncbi:hypothetical protein J6590_058623 [Homalodisca vitripennis]|nr:hypothetical protein J6590_058623 [Homalodisca vitripennis]